MRSGPSLSPLQAVARRAYDGGVTVAPTARPAIPREPSTPFPPGVAPIAPTKPPPAPAGPPTLTIGQYEAGPAQPGRTHRKGYLSVRARELLGDPEYVLLGVSGRTLHVAGFPNKAHPYALKVIRHSYVSGSQLGRLLGPDGANVRIELRESELRGVLVGDLPDSVSDAQLAEAAG